MRRVAIPSSVSPRRRGSAAVDERPSVIGSRVRLLGELRDGPAGVVIGVDGNLRWVELEGHLEPVLIPLTLLRRLP